MKWLLICSVFLICCKSSSKVGIAGKTWILIELNGNPVIAGSNRTPQLIFNDSEKKFSGNTGCNSMAGNYEIKDGNRITLSNIITTKMACTDNIEMETQLLNALEQADNYNMTGETLVLNKARMAPLARFKRN